MKRIGVVLLVLGGAGFAWASSVRSGFDTVEGAFKSTFSSEQRSRKALAENGRWVALAVGALGAVLIVLPAKKG